MSTDQTHDEQLAEGQHRFGRHGDDDDVLEGQLIEPEADSHEDPAVAAADDPNRPVDDPIVMDTAPVDPEDDRVVLDSHDDATDPAAPDPASPAAAGYEDRDGTYGSDGATTTNSAIPMPGGSATAADDTADDDAAYDATPAETTMDDGTIDGTAPVSGTEADATPAAAQATPADVPAPGAVPAAETSGTTGQPVSSNGSATDDRVAGIEQWNEIKAMFVDDPRAATQRAASLVDDRVGALLASIKEQQQSMQSDWQGDGADTEQLRTALQHYRTFWTRLEEFSHQA